MLVWALKISRHMIRAKVFKKNMEKENRFGNDTFKSLSSYFKLISAAITSNRKQRKR